MLFFLFNVFVVNFVFFDVVDVDCDLCIGVVLL